ncbi:hypothetical protein LWI29_019794 [Acer saccharum]|uniref:Uncharacterized protein n=1 Tax=Acer saccharum TaxID=4024 RepID=A0AA39SP68_ACESA|nr:hypothetical protein LWI29_019794 [Acer saccharum]
MDEISLRHVPNQGTQGIALPQRDQMVVHTYKPNEYEIPESIATKDLALARETQISPQSVKKRANRKVPVGRNGKKKAGEVSDFTNLRDESFVEAVEVDLLEDPSCDLITREAHLEKRKATGHPFEPACKIPKELTFVDSSSDEESSLADQKEEADVPTIEAVNKYTGEDEVIASTVDTLSQVKSASVLAADTVPEKDKQKGVSILPDTLPLLPVPSPSLCLLLI